MKKLFLSLLALVAMVVTANAQRAWAYDLSLTSESESYTFTFKATTAATATLILSDEEGNNVGTLDLGAVVAGSNTFTYTTDQLPKAGKMNWAVKLAGEAIADLVEVTDASKGIYNFYLPQGVAVDNNPESSTFGNIYVAQSTNGASDGGSTRADNQKQGIFIYDQTLAELNPTSNVGIIPSNVTLSSTTNRQAMKRIVINPVTNEVAFIHNLDPVAIWAVPANNVGGEAKNLIDGLGFTAANAACFGEDGSLYVLVSPGYPDPGSLYKITDGVVDTLFANYGKFGNADVALASDGRGGVWIAQNRGQLDGFNQLTHVNAAGEIDFEVNSTTPNGIESANTARGTMAYNPNEDVLALGIGATNTIGASLYKVTYDAETGVPSLAFLAKTPSLGKNVDGLAFDYAGDLYGLSANKERFYKYAVPTNNNVCTTPAPKAQVLINTDQTVYAVTTVVNEEAMGTVTGAGNYLAGESATLTATANTGYRFVNWTVGEETKTENPLTLTVNSDLTVIANFEAIPTYTITASVNDENMGAVEGAGTYYEGEKVSLTATPKQGYAFVAWSNDATDNPLVFTATEDVELTANFEILSYTLTVAANDAAKGSVDVTTGTYEYGTEVTITATPTEGHEFAGWSNGSKANPLTITVKEDTELTANFRQVLATSITLNALPVQDYSATIVGTLKRALQNGENTIVLTHEANGTPHIYNVAHATNTVTEISQEGVVAVDPDNKGDYLSISDIALTEDGKLVATNKIVCQSEDGQVAAGYKRGELRAYIWNDLAGAPSLWFTSKQSSNWYRSIQGHTIAYKGTSTNGTLFATGVTASGVKFRYSVYNVIDGVYTDPSSNNSDYYHFTKGSAQTTDALGANYQLVASPLASPNWILDGELVEPFEIVDPLTFNTEVTANPTLSVNLGKKYNGASCLANYNEHHLMVAPYANGEGYLAGVKVVDVVDGFAAATELTTNTDLATAENATAAAATAVVDAEGKLTIHLFSDAKVYTFTQKEQGPATAVDNTTVAPQVQKIVRDGQVLIIRDGKTFNMMGQEVK